MRISAVGMRRRTSLVRRKPHADRRSRAAFAHAPASKIAKGDHAFRKKTQSERKDSTPHPARAATTSARRYWTEAILDRHNGDRMCQALRRSHVPGTSCWECAPQNFASILSERERSSVFERNQAMSQPCASRGQVRPNWSFKDEESNTVDLSGPLNVRSPCREQRRLCPTWQRRLREPDTNLWWRAISISTRSSHDQRAGQRCYVLARPVLPLA